MKAYTNNSPTNYSLILKPAATALTLALSLALSGCGGGSSDSTDSSSGMKEVVSVAVVKTITLIDYNDLHAHLVPHKELIKTADGTKKTAIRGGLPQIKTLIDGIRAENCNSVLMNIGDTYHGGVEAFYTDGQAIIDPVNALGIDVGVPGNWDFAYGSDATHARYDGIKAREYKGCTVGDNSSDTAESTQPNFVNLASNVLNDADENGVADSAETWLPPTHLIDVDGVKVGFIGITSDIVPDMQESMAKTFIFLRGEDTYRDLINQYAKDLRAQGANIVVVMSELGIQKDLKLGDVINPGVDFIFSAHTHELVYKPFVTASGTEVAEAGPDSFFARLDIRWDVTNNKIIDKTWKIIEVTPDTPADPAMQALVDAARGPFLVATPVLDAKYGQTLTQSIETVVGKTDKALDRRNALENSFNRAYTTVLKKVAKTDLAVSAGWRYDTPLPVEGTAIEGSPVDAEGNPVLASGDITLEDMYRFFPFHVPLSVGTVTGAKLKEVEELTLAKTFSTDVFTQSGGWEQGSTGFDMKLNLAAPDGQRVTEMRLQSTGEVIDTDLNNATTYTVAGCAPSLKFISDGISLCGESVYQDVVPLPNDTTASDTTDNWDALNLFIYALQHNDAGQIDWVNNMVNGVQAPSITDTNNTPLWPVSDYVQPLYGVGAAVDVPLQ